VSDAGVAEKHSTTLYERTKRKEKKRGAGNARELVFKRCQKRQKAKTKKLLKGLVYRQIREGTPGGLGSDVVRAGHSQRRLTGLANKRVGENCDAGGRVLNEKKKKFKKKKFFR